MHIYVYVLIYIYIFICHAGANQHLLLRERPPIQLAPVLGRSQGRLAHPLHRLFGRGRLQEVCGRQRRVTLLWRGQVHGRGASTGAELLSRMMKLQYNWKYLFLRPTMSKTLSGTIASFSTSPARAAPVDATTNAPTAAHTAAPAAVAAVAARSAQGSHRRLGT